MRVAPLVRYTLALSAPLSHRLTVQCTLACPTHTEQTFRLPTWTPGSYLIREFARHASGAVAHQAGTVLPVHKVDKQTWVCQDVKPNIPLTFSLEIHALDRSVRGAFFDSEHAFINGSAVFPEALGWADQCCELEISAPPCPGGEAWVVFTTLPPKAEARAPETLGIFSAENYAFLLDHPLEMGDPKQYVVLDFKAAGLPHRMSLYQPIPFDEKRLTTDLQRICETIIALFGPPQPFESYLFMTTLTADGYGGLEHGNSTALMACREDLPTSEAETPPDKAYTRFLGLCAHEYFHAWLVKGIRDSALSHSDLSGEAYTNLLWFFEGFTSYYDDLILHRSGILDADAYLKLLEKTVQHGSDSPGRFRQSLSEASFDAWIKYYRPDENTPNSTVSYYTRGALVALCLDLTLRKQGSSTDAWLRALWQDCYPAHQDIQETGLFAHLSGFAGEAIANSLKTWVSVPGELPLTTLLADQGVSLTHLPAEGPHYLGLILRPEKGLACVSHVLDKSPAERAGIAPGDRLLAINGLRLNPETPEGQCTRFDLVKGGECTVFRDDRLLTLRVPAGASPIVQSKLSHCAESTPAKNSTESWLSFTSKKLTEA